MHPAQVVTHDPGAQGIEVVACGPDGGGPAGPTPAVVARGVGEGQDRLDGRVHDQLGLGGDGPGRGGQGQGVEAPGLEGAHGEHAPPSGGDAVRGPLLLPRAEGGEEQPGPPRPPVDGIP